MATTKLLLTPKELARAIGASESSLRRWVDGGLIPMSRTAGGHRRIPLAAAVQFIRRTGATVVRPEILGLVETGDAGGGLPAAADDENLFDALAAGDRNLARGLVLSAYLAGQGLAAIFDGPVRNAMRRLGELWRHDERGILVEHRATEICTGAVAQLRELLPPVDPATAPLALGGAPQGDPYRLPSLMAGMVLAEAGYRDVNFGPDTPVELLGREALDRGARLVWLSVSATGDAAALRGAIKRLAATLAKRNVRLALGGLRAAGVAPPATKNLDVMGSMAELSEYARGLLRE